MANQRKPKRRKPRRKRKFVEPTQPNDIPFSKYRIEWIDIIIVRVVYPVKHIKKIFLSHVF